jgi:hypothetical protein
MYYRSVVLSYNLAKTDQVLYFVSILLRHFWQVWSPQYLFPLPPLPLLVLLSSWAGQQHIMTRRLSASSLFLQRFEAGLSRGGCIQQSVWKYSCYSKSHFQLVGGGGVESRPQTDTLFLRCEDICLGLMFKEVTTVYFENKDEIFNTVFG